VSVTVDDLSGPSAQRLTSFSDPGSQGELLSPLYFDAWMPGCCGGATIHSLRSLEDGRLLFRATGDAAGGSSAWAQAPNVRPALLRWAAFDGQVGSDGLDQGVVGWILYGGPQETRSRLEVRGPVEAAVDLNLGLSHAAGLVWVDDKSQAAGYEPAAGTPANPTQIWSLDGIAEAGQIGGFALRLTDYEGNPLLTIPVEGDRLVATRAQAAPGFSVTESRP
jgi:hypothetical protein